MTGDSPLLLRSMMFVPGHNERLLRSAARSAADALILDLEDSVMPVSEKAVARNLIRRMVTDGAFPRSAVFPRVNDRESGLLLKDVHALTIEGVAGFVFPKAKNGEDIYFIDKLLETIEYEKGYPVGKFKLVPLIETASAVLNAQAICRASKRVVAIAFGCEDFIADLRGIHDREGESLFAARSMIAMAARASGVIPVDTVHINVHDLEHLEQNCRLARNLGFEGMLVLHPKELDLAHRYFSPSKAEVDSARQMVALSQEAERQGRGVAVMDGKFVGPPLVLAAKKILERHQLICARQDVT